jgi:hypothetical protein
MKNRGKSVTHSLSFNPQRIKKVSSVNYSFSRLIVDLVKEKRLDQTLGYPTNICSTRYRYMIYRSLQIYYEIVASEPG